MPFWIQHRTNSNKACREGSLDQLQVFFSTAPRVDVGQMNVLDSVGLINMSFMKFSVDTKVAVLLVLDSRARGDWASGGDSCLL